MKVKTTRPNPLNDLNGSEWIQLSKSYWFQKGLGNNHPESKFEKQHPAPFSYQDIEKLIRMFTKEGMTVLDPFCGVASTLKAAALCNRNAIGIEISTKWIQLGKQRLEKEIPKQLRQQVCLKIISGDCTTRLSKIHKESIDFVVTSPPYWGILNKVPDHKIINTRIKKGLATKYSTSEKDLGNIKKYSDFLSKISEVAKKCHLVLKKGKYMAMIVGDFRNGRKYYTFHTDVQKIFEKNKFTLQGIIVLVQNNKRLYPYGYPYAFVPNIHHQYILIFRK
ncbi:MAG: DNA methylase [Euryarchaeota archaeon]|nr:DNA methylase [Euryarchaeota archaeon]